MKNILTLELDPKRVYGLDILRAFAILFVVIEHGGYLLPKNIRRITDVFVFDGVSIFLVLSGFLIGGILIKILQNNVNKYALFDFWIRRWFRTIPTYFFVLFVLAILNLIVIENFTLYSIRQYFVFSQNLFTPHPSFFSEAWSLSIEEWFYLLIPLALYLLVILFNISPQASIVTVAISVIIIITYFRFQRYQTISIESTQDWDMMFRKQVSTRLDSLMFGLIGASMHYYHATKWFRHKSLLLVLGMFIFIASKFLLPEYIPQNELYDCVFSFSVLSLATLLLLPFLSSVKSGHGSVYKGITYVSLTSYSMYLINLSLVQYWILEEVPWTGVFESDYILAMSRYGMYWLLVIVLSILLYKYYELPMTKLRDSENVRKLLSYRHQLNKN